MRLFVLLAACAAPFLVAATPSSARAQEQLRQVTVLRCARADTLFGRYWRSHASSVRAAYSPQTDTTTILTPDRRVGWQAGPSHLAGSEAAIQIPGLHRVTDSARIRLSLRFVDSINRTSEQARLTLRLDDTVHVEIQEPHVDYAMGARTAGIPLVLTALLTPEQSLALARAHDVKGTMGPYSFFLYDWELWDINAVYRASFCGID